METKQPSATITDAQRLKLLKWAKKNGVAKISVGGVEIEFLPLEKKQSDLFYQMPLPPKRPPVADPYANVDQDTISIEEADRDARLAAFHAERTWPHKASDSTESAVSALRSRLEDPEAFARQTDAWANQTRLPRE